MWTWILANSLLAGLLALAGLALARTWRSRPASQHMLWVVALIVLVAPPWSLFLIEEAGTEGGWIARLESWVVREPGRVAEATPLEATRYVPPASESESFGEPPKPAGFRSDEPLVADDMAERAEDGEPREVVKSSDEESITLKPHVQGTEVFAARSGLISAETARIVSSVLKWTWLSGTALFLIIVSVGTLRLRRRLRRSIPAPTELTRLVRAIATRFEVQPPRVRIATGLGAPFIWSMGRPTLVWPMDEDGEPAVPFDTGIVAHELAHLRRRDHWVAWLELIATTALWWNPLLWILRARIRHYSEMAADAWVVWAFPGGRRHYAETLIDAATELPRNGRLTPALGALDSSARSFRSRLEVIMRGETAARAVSPAVLLVAGVALLLAWPVRAAVEMGQPGTAEVVLPARLESAIEREASLRLLSYSLTTGDWETAVPLLEECVALGKDVGRSTHLLGFGQIKLGQPERALEAFAAQHELGFRQSVALYNTACAQSLLGNAEEGLDALERAVRAGFDQAKLMAVDTDLDLLRGEARFTEALAIVQEVDQAQLAARQVLTTLPVSPEGLAKGLFEIRRAEALQPDASDRQKAFGTWLRRAGAFEEAAIRFRSRLEVDPSDDVALYGLACCEARMTDSGLTWNELQRSQWLGLDLETPLADPAWSWLVKSGRLAGLERRSNPGSRALWLGARRSARSGNWAEARRQLEALLTLDDSIGAAWEQLGIVAFRGGDLVTARQAHERQIVLGHAIDRGLVQLARIAARDDDRDAAFALWHRVLDLGWTGAVSLLDDPDLAPDRKSVV